MLFRSEKLRLAYSLSGELHAINDIEVLLGKLLNRVFEWLPVDRGMVLLVDDKVPEGADGVADQLRQAIVRCKPGVVLSGDEAEVKVPRSILKQVLLRKEAVLSTDASVVVSATTWAVVSRPIGRKVAST